MHLVLTWIAPHTFERRDLLSCQAGLPQESVRNYRRAVDGPSWIWRGPRDLDFVYYPFKGRL